MKRLWRLAVSQSPEVDARLIAKGLQAALCLPVIPLNARGHERNPSRYGSAGCPTPHPGRVLATLSHELRTPLNAVLGWANILQLGKRQGEELIQGLDIIERNARIQAQIIEGSARYEPNHLGQSSP